MAEPPRIQLDDEYVLDGWEDEDASSHRAFAEDALAARFLGWSVEDARAQPDSHYVEVVRRFQDHWATGTRFSLAIRRIATGEAVGAVELRPVGESVEVSYLVAPTFRRRGLAVRGLDAFLDWARLAIPCARAILTCHVDNLGSRRVAEKCGFVQVSREGDDVHFAREP
jgi:RimJ/RimL family protein N-acetyltransferase